MGKQWLYLLALAFVMMGIYFAWDLFVTNQAVLSSTAQIAPINTDLYEGLVDHFNEDDRINEYEEIADEVNSLEYFIPENNQNTPEE